MRVESLRSSLVTTATKVKEKVFEPVNTWLAEFLTEQTENIPVEGKEYLDEIFEYLEEGYYVVIIPPHWSVADIVIFTFLAKYFDRTVCGPMSSKFVDGRMGLLGDLTGVLAKMNVELSPVVQVQDEKVQINDSIHSPWLDIFKGFINSRMLGIFPQGTRSRTKGAQKAPDEVLEKIKKLSGNKKVVFLPIALAGAISFWSTEQKIPNLSKFSQLRIQVAQPVSLEEANEIAKMLGCKNPVAVPLIMALAKLPSENWGDYTDQVNAYKAISESKKVNNLDESPS